MTTTVVSTHTFTHVKEYQSALLQRERYLRESKSLVWLSTIYDETIYQRAKKELRDMLVQNNTDMYKAAKAVLTKVEAIEKSYLSVKGYKRFFSRKKPTAELTQVLLHTTTVLQGQESVADYITFSQTVEGRGRFEKRSLTGAMFLLASAIMATAMLVLFPMWPFIPVALVALYFYVKAGISMLDTTQKEELGKTMQTLDIKPEADKLEVTPKLKS